MSDDRRPDDRANRPGIGHESDRASAHGTDRPGRDARPAAPRDRPAGRRPAAVIRDRLGGALPAPLRRPLRALLRSPRFTVPTIVSLALGIGAALPVADLVRIESLSPPRIASPALALDAVPTPRIDGLATDWRATSESLQHTAFAGMLALLLAAGALGLVVACVDVAILVLGRAAGRRRPIAVRRALGATRRRIAPAGLLEGVLLGAAGATVGLALGSLLGPALE
ncbi:MAG: FtsX-like permease family protein, partial [Gemmatimonadota bacterium]